MSKNYNTAAETVTSGWQTFRGHFEGKHFLFQKISQTKVVYFFSRTPNQTKINMSNLKNLTFGQFDPLPAQTGS